MCVRTRSDQGSGLRCREWARERRRARSRPDSDALLRFWLSCASLHLSRALSASPTPGLDVGLGCLAFLALSQRNEAELRVRATDGGVCSLLGAHWHSSQRVRVDAASRPELHALVLAAAFTGAQPVKASTVSEPLRYSMQNPRTGC